MSKTKYTKYTIDDINNINNNSDSDSKLILIGKKVVDITILIDNHPGGNNCLLKKLGTDCTKDMKFHSASAKKLIKKLTIGKLI